MNRFQKNRIERKKNRLTAGTVVMSAAVLVCAWTGITSVSASTERQQKNSLEEALQRDIVLCYALEGRYPQSLDYLKEHYGLAYDEKKYVISYEVLGSNLMPDVKVMEKRKDA